MPDTTTRQVAGIWCLDCGALVLASDAVGYVRIECPKCHCQYEAEYPHPGGKIRRLGKNRDYPYRPDGSLGW